MKFVKNFIIISAEMIFSITDFYSFTKQSFRVEGYRAQELEDKIEVAV